MKVALVEPFFTGSHKNWAEGFKKHSRFEIEILSLSGANWKWRMHGGGVTLSERLNNSEFTPDLILATDMLDVATFKANLSSSLSRIPVVTYFHENQITYPWSATDEDVNKNRDNHYGFINYTTALVSDLVLFNSEYHHTSFVSSLPQFLRQFPDFHNLDTINRIERKAEVVPLGLDLSEFDRAKPANISKPKRATVLWNHRWEYDKNPEEFFESLIEIKNRGWEFNLVVLGESFRKQPEIFSIAKSELQEQIVHWGYVDSFEEYAKLLWQADILPVTSNQDFFGGSIVEAMFCNVKPLLPKRLAYPEHIPEFLHQTFFYEQGELVNKLQRWIKDVSILRKQQTRSYVSRYDWTQIAPQLDRALQKVTSESAN